MRVDLRRFLQADSKQPFKTPFYQVPPTEPSPKPVEPVSTISNSTITDINVPIKTDETQTIFRSVEPQAKQTNNLVYLLISVLVGGLIIGGIALIGFSVSNFFGNDSELSSSKPVNSSNSSPIKNLSNNSSNLNSSNADSSANLANNSNSEDNSNSENVNAGNIATPKPTPDKAQLQTTINRYIAGVAKVSGNADEPKQFRTIVYGDIDGDGDEDVVV